MGYFSWAQKKSTTHLDDLFLIVLESLSQGRPARILGSQLLRPVKGHVIVGSAVVNLLDFPTRSLVVVQPFTDCEEQAGVKLLRNKSPANKFVLGLTCVHESVAQ